MNFLLFSFLIITIIKFIESQSCELLNPETNNCVRSTIIEKENNFNCCEVSPQNKNLGFKNKCMLFDNNTPESIILDGVNFLIKCNESSKEVINTNLSNPIRRNNEVLSFIDDASCGKTLPTYENDCYRDSLPDNSCCYFKYNKYSACFRLGSQFNGKSSYQGIEFSCISKYLSFAFVILVTFLI